MTAEGQRYQAMTSSRAFRWALAATYAHALGLAMVAPSSTMEGVPAFPQADKVAHALFYGGLAFLICWWWGKAVVSVRGAVLAALGTQCPFGKHACAV